MPTFSFIIQPVSLFILLHLKCNFNNMKKFILAIFTFSYFISCNPKKAIVDNNNQKVITNNQNYKDWQRDFGLTHNINLDTIWKKPVKFYVENPSCSPIAKDFYWGKFRPTDNDSTATLLSLITTENNDLRPFYRWCLLKTIQIQDGALGEYTGVPARQYVEKYPNEFFEYMDADTTNSRYTDWTASIAYSGFYDQDDYKKPKEIKARMIQKIKSNCKNIDTTFEKRIAKLVAECF
jgi:hypothetical protein